MDDNCTPDVERTVQMHGTVSNSIAFIALLLVMTVAVAKAQEEVAGGVDSYGYTAVITVIAGDGVELKFAGVEEWTGAEEELELGPGTMLKTGRDSRAEMQLRDNSIIRVDSLSVMTVGEPSEGNVELNMESGKVWCRLKELGEGESFYVSTPSVSAGVRGTTFWVDAEGEEESVVGVEEGEVEAVRGEKRVRIGRLKKLRALKGRMGDAEGFNPEKRKRWEEFTNAIVDRRLEELHQAVKQHAEAAQELVERVHEFIAQVAAFEKKVRTAAQITKGYEGKIDKISAAAGKLENAVEKQERLRPRARAAALEKTRGQVVKLLNMCDAIDDGLKQYADQREIYRVDTIDTLRSTVEDIYSKIEEMKRNREKFARRQEMFRQRREFDPHWKVMERIYEAIKSRTGELKKNEEESERLVLRAEDTSVDKKQALKEHISSLADYIRKAREEYDQMTMEHEKTKKKLRRMLEEIESILKE